MATQGGRKSRGGRTQTTPHSRTSGIRLSEPAGCRRSLGRLTIHVLNQTGLGGASVGLVATVTGRARFCARPSQSLGIDGQRLCTGDWPTSNGLDTVRPHERRHDAPPACCCCHQAGSAHCAGTYAETGSETGAAQSGCNQLKACRSGLSCGTASGNAAMASSVAASAPP